LDGPNTHKLAAYSVTTHPSINLFAQSHTGDGGTPPTTHWKSSTYRSRTAYRQHVPRFLCGSLAPLRFAGRATLGLTLVDDAEGYSILRQQANAMNLHHYRLLQSPTYYFPDMLKAIARAKDELILPEQYALFAQQMLEQASDDEEAAGKAEKAHELAQVYTLYQQELQRRGDTDFGGLLVLTIQLLNEHAEVLQEVQQILRIFLSTSFRMSIEPVVSYYASWPEKHVVSGRRRCQSSYLWLPRSFSS